MSDHRLEQSKQEHQDLLNLIDQNIDLKRWGFVQSYSRINIDRFPFVIYDSQSCRVKIHYKPADYGNYSEREASVWYGRLHMMNDGEYVTVNEKDVVYWHRLRFNYYVLNFLDGLSPQDVIEGKGQEPRVVYQFETSSLGWVLPEENLVARALKELRLHNKIWEYYGQRLFDVFDLRNPALWEKYVQFHNEIKRLQYEIWKAKERVEKPFKQFDEFEPDNLC
jgi:hypothetical protein